MHCARVAVRALPRRPSPAFLSEHLTVAARSHGTRAARIPTGNAAAMAALVVAASAAVAATYAHTSASEFSAALDTRAAFEIRALTPLDGR